MKKDNKGFLLAESLIVSTFILTVLILLYIQFSNLVTNYKNSYSYNNVESIYNLSSMSNYLLENHIIVNDFLNENKPYVLISKNGNCNVEIGITDNFCDEISKNMNAKTIIYTASDLTDIKNYVLNTEDKDIGPKFRNFISRVETKIIQNKGRLFAEFNNETYATIALDATSLKINDLKGLVKNDGTDGLYEDKYEPGRYIYRGLNPDNYLTFNNETAGWRIVAIEKDNTVKIVKDNDIGSMPFDSSGYRNPSNAGTYCSDSYNGCNAWAANNNLVGSPPMFSVGRNSGTVLKDAEINTYLNTTYYNLIKESDRNKIVPDHEFYVGGVASDTLSINEIANSEASYVWKGKIALLNISDVLKINLNESECTYGSWGAGNCYFQNYLSSNNKRFYTLNPTWNGSDNYFLWSPIVTLPYDGGPYSVYASGYRGNDWLNVEVVPTMYLKNNIKLSGSGTKENPYKII